jgi:hypothetical protein
MTTKKLLLAVAALGLCVTVAACKTTPPPKPMGKALTGAELQAQYASGKPIASSGKSLISGNSWKITRDGVNSQTIQVVGSDFTDTGTYRIADNTICSKWVKIRDGAEVCSTIYVRPDGTYEAANAKGEKTAEFVLQPGG